ncbi:MAG: ESX secretion-associated protein EspG [Sciscionella sp.]
MRTPSSRPPGGALKPIKTRPRASAASSGRPCGGRDGRRSRAPRPVSWVDTPEGRHGFRVGDGWLTVTPIDLARLYAMAEELLGEATQVATAGVG